MWVFKHVESVNQVKLLVPALAQIKVQGCLCQVRVLLLLDLHQFHELFILNRALPCLDSAIIERHKE